MNPNLTALLMGLIQGFTEFLPVSSSGHLSLFELRFSAVQVPLFFDILLHVATLLAVMIFTRSLLKTILTSLLQMFRGRAELHDRQSLKVLLYVVVSTLCTAPLAFFCKFFLFEQNIFIENETLFLGLGFLCTAVILMLSLTRTRNTKSSDSSSASGRLLSDISITSAVIIGLAQGVAVLPGISRSGITISVALFTGVSRKNSTYYSFLIAIPSILASFLLSLDGLDTAVALFSWQAIIIGAILAFASGLLSLTILRYIVKKGQLWLFSAYLFPLALTVLIWHFTSN